MTPFHRILEALGINQIEAAKILGRSQPTISKWLNGKNNGEPTISDLQKLRAEFARRGIEWDDKYIMGAPDEAA